MERNAAGRSRARDVQVPSAARTTTPKKSRASSPTEHGKTLDEARGSVRRGIECVEVACGAPSLLMGYGPGECRAGTRLPGDAARRSACAR
jgi:hypothetical protein